MASERVSTQTEYLRVEVGARVAALVLVYVLIALGDGQSVQPLLLTALAVACALPVQSRAIRRWRPLAEEVLAACIIVSSDPPELSLLPYLVVPALSAGLVGGWISVVITAGAGASVLLGRAVVTGELTDSQYFVDISQWLLLALAVGLLGSWIRGMQRQRSTDAQRYAEASRLLAQLRDVSRQLSGGLDAVTLAQSQLEATQPACPFDSGCVFVRSPGGLLVLLATDSSTGVALEPDLSPDAPWGATWRSGQPHRSATGLTDDPSMVSVVLPLRLEDAVIGLIGLERRGVSFDDQEVAAALHVLDEGAPRLDAALLFEDVRALATTEERRRLAREIHDGIAQELASMGYAVDELTARADTDRPELAASLRDLRGELSRVITELRLSIFDLRTDVGPGTSLAAALADHSQSVGAQTGMTVHLELAETPTRLRIETETELLRIAQEAIANARKHAGARNLWVTCRIDPPDALLRVTDDGRGMTPGRADSYGFEIMSERSSRIGGQLEVSPRPGGGTVVQVSIGQLAKEVAHDDSHPARR